MTSDILDSTFFTYMIGDQQLIFRVPRMGALKGAARRNADLICMAIDAIDGQRTPGTWANDDAVVRAATDIMRETDIGEEVLRDSLRGDQLPELSAQAEIDILANIVCATWQMYGTLTLKAEIANIYHEFRSQAGRWPARLPAALATTARH